MKLNIGCGRDIKKGYINLDKYDIPGVNVVHDIEKGKFPFNDNTFNEIYCCHILEHLHTFEDFIHVMEEIHRTVKKTGIVIIKVPHASTCFRLTSHHLGFGYKSFTGFFSNETQNYENYYTKARFKQVYCRMGYGVLRNKFWWKPVHWFLNWLGRKHPSGYEEVLSGVFPINEMEVHLRKV